MRPLRWVATAQLPSPALPQRAGLVRAPAVPGEPNQVGRDAEAPNDAYDGRPRLPAAAWAKRSLVTASRRRVRVLTNLHRRVQAARHVAKHDGDRRCSPESGANIHHTGPTESRAGAVADRSGAVHASAAGAASRDRAPFPAPAHQTGHAVLPHPAFRGLSSRRFRRCRVPRDGSSQLIHPELLEVRQRVALRRCPASRPVFLLRNNASRSRT